MGNTDRRELLNDLEEGFRVAFDGRQVGIWTAIPGIVQSVNMVKLTCVVQPAIQGSIINQNGVSTLVNLPLLVDCPIVFTKGGGFLFTVPLAVHDEVLVVFSSRCIDAWWQQGGVQPAMELRMHDLSDGFAIPGPFSQPKRPLGPVSTDTMQMRNDAGDAYVEIDGSGNINIVGNTVVINGKNFASHEHFPGTYTAGATPVTGDSGGVV